MTQLGLLDPGPGWYSVSVTWADMQYSGTLRWHESEADAQAYGKYLVDRRRDRLVKSTVAVKQYDGTPPFAEQRRAEWDAAARGVPLVVGRYGVRNPTTGRRYENE